MLNVLRDKIGRYWRAHKAKRLERDFDIYLNTTLQKLPSEIDRAEHLFHFIQSAAKEMPAKDSLRFLFMLDKLIYLLEGKEAIRYGNKVHPKHRITRFHQFFIDRVGPGDRVLEIGSGKGSLAHAIAASVKECQVTGLELSQKRVELAQQLYVLPNLKFVQADVLKGLDGFSCDVAVLSNFLEHIEPRVAFLRDLLTRTQPKKLLVRVPQFDRDWRLPLKEEVGMDALYPGHYLEYTRETLADELVKGGWRVASMEFRWGEIWAEAEPHI